MVVSRYLLWGARPVLKLALGLGIQTRDSDGRPHLHRPLTRQPSVDLRRLKVGGNPLKMPRILQHIE